MYERHSCQTQEILVNSKHSLAELISDNCLHLTTDHRFRGKGVYCQTAKLRHKTIDVQYLHTIRVTTSVNYLKCDKPDANITMLMSFQHLNILTEVTIGNFQSVFADQKSSILFLMTFKTLTVLVCLRKGSRVIFFCNLRIFLCFCQLPSFVCAFCACVPKREDNLLFTQPTFWKRFEELILNKPGGLLISFLDTNTHYLFSTCYQIYILKLW